MNIDKDILCTPLAIEVENGEILKLFFGFFQEGAALIALADYTGEIYQIKPKDESFMASAVAKRGYLLLDKELAKKEEFKFKNLSQALEQIKKETPLKHGA